MLLGMLVAANATPPETVYKLDLRRSAINWTGKKVAGSHSGNIYVKSGSIVMDKNKIKSGSFEIDMNSITCTDLDADNGRKLVKHLQSEDFFNVAKYATAKFVITKATLLKDGSYDITGDLTIKGITKPLSFKTTLDGKGSSKVAVGTITVDRTKYDIKYGSSNFFEGLGDKVIDNDFTLVLSLVFG